MLPRDELRVNGLPAAYWVGVTLKTGLVLSWDFRTSGRQRNRVCGWIDR